MMNREELLLQLSLELKHEYSEYRRKCVDGVPHYVQERHKKRVLSAIDKIDSINNDSINTELRLLVDDYTRKLKLLFHYKLDTLK